MLLLIYLLLIVFAVVVISSHKSNLCDVHEKYITFACLSCTNYSCFYFRIIASLYFYTLILIQYFFSLEKSDTKLHEHLSDSH